MQKQNLTAALLGAVGGCLCLSSCVNDDYDLNKDIDMTIQVGGDLTVPTSETSEMKMKDILDLEEDDVVRVLGKDSVYYLIKEADKSAHFEFELDTIEVEDPDLDDFKMVYKMPSQKELLGRVKKSNGESLSDEEKEDILADPSKLSAFGVNLNDVFESAPIELEKDMHILNEEFELPKEVMKLDSIGFRSPMQTGFTVTTTQEHGSVRLYKIVAEFPRELMHDHLEIGGAWAWKLNENQRHEFQVPDNTVITHDGAEQLKMEFVYIDYRHKPWTREEHTDGILKLDEEVHMHGSVTVKATANEFLNMAGKDYSLNLTVDLTTPKLSAVRVVVDPEIEPDVTTVEMDDLPDFLTDNDVSIILQHPVIKLEVDNNTPVAINCWGNLTTDKGKDVAINYEDGTDLQLGGNVDANWYIYGGKEPSDEVKQNYRTYKASGLERILDVMPERINISFDARANQEYYTFELGSNYSATVDYRIECPLAFAAGTQIVYTDTIDDWNSDIEDYEVEHVRMTATVENQTPLEVLDIEVIPVDLEKNPIPNITVNKITGVKNGDKIEINLLSEQGAMANLDGILLKATAKVVSDNMEPLRANSSIKLDNISVGIVGGVIADLN